MWLTKTLLVSFALLLCQKTHGTLFQNFNPVKSVSNTIQSGVSGAKNLAPVRMIGKGIQIVKNVLNPSAILNNIQIMVPDPKEVAKNVVQLVNTTGVFNVGGSRLNCFGLPIAFVDKALELIFMQTTIAEDVKFSFSTRKLSDSVVVRLQDEFTLNDIDFDVRRPTVLMVHGFMSSGKESWLSDMKNAFLDLDDANTIVVDWQQGSNTWNYYTAAISTRIVGLQIAKLFAKLRDLALASGQSPSISDWGMIYFVGHSLGSHISAHAAYLIKESQKDQPESWTVTRITGLDPAQPCFTVADPSLKLDVDDAPYVDVIHTNARTLLFLGLGLPDQLGWTDFYPNGGKAQPGCSDVDTHLWNLPLIPVEMIKESICSHGRSHAFLTEAIKDLAYRNCTFKAYRWSHSSGYDGKSLHEKCEVDGCTEMGVLAQRDYPMNSGMFYVPTRANPPYCGFDEEAPIVSQNEQSNPSILSRMSRKLLPSRY